MVFMIISIKWINYDYEKYKYMSMRNINIGLDYSEKYLKIWLRGKGVI